MNRVSLLAAALLVLSACGGGEGPESTGPERVVTYFENGRVILGDGSPPIENAALVVDNGVIIGVGPRDQVAHPPGAERYDLANHTLVPFVHDAHAHAGYLVGSIMAADNYTRENILLDLDRYLYYGVGTVALLGTDVGDEIFSIRDAVASGQIVAPRILTAGRGITGRNGFPAADIEGLEEAPYQVASEAEARSAVQELAARNVDFVKVWVDDNRRVTGQIFRAGRLTDQFSTTPKLAPALYQAVIDEARQAGIPVVAHVRYLEDAKALVAAGVSGLVHSVRDRAVDNALIQAMLQNDVFYIPTLSAHQAQFVYADEPSWVGELSMRESVSGAVIARLASRGFIGGLQQNPNLAGWRNDFNVALQNAKTLYDAGVRVGLGTDSGGGNRYPGYFAHRELELLVQAGLTPAQAIQLGAQTTAAILGTDDMGTLEVGKRGSFLIVPGQPYDDIRATRDIAEVVKDGVRVDRAVMMSRFMR